MGPRLLQERASCLCRVTHTLLHNGRVDYWPNLGYGEFGERITMTNAPHLEYNFDPKRLFMVDLDGTGCADMVYVDFDKVHFWFNQSGNDLLA